MRDLGGNNNSSGGGGSRKTGTTVAAAVAFLESRKVDNKVLPDRKEISLNQNRTNGTSVTTVDEEVSDKSMPSLKVIAEKRRKLEETRFRAFSNDKSCRQTKCGIEEGRNSDGLELELPSSCLDMTAEDVRRFLAESMLKIENASREAAFDGCMQTSGEYVISDDFDECSTEEDDDDNNEDGIENSDSDSNCSSTTDNSDFSNGAMRKKGLATIDEEGAFINSDAENIAMKTQQRIDEDLLDVRATKKEQKDVTTSEEEENCSRKNDGETHKNRYIATRDNNNQRQKNVTAQDEKKTKQRSSFNENQSKPSSINRAPRKWPSNKNQEYFENHENKQLTVLPPNSESSSTDSDSSTLSSSYERNYQKEASTRCNGDFQWIPKPPTGIVNSKPPLMGGGVRERTPRRHKSPIESANVQIAPGGSLDRTVRRKSSSGGGGGGGRQERDQKSRSSHLKSPPRLDDFVPHPPSGGCCCCNNTVPFEYFDNFHRRHERLDPMRYGSNPMLMEQKRGSHPNLYDNCMSSGGGMPSYHMPPPPMAHYYYYGDPRGSYYPLSSINKIPDQDERFRKVQSERDNLQLQVQVLSEQIEAQNEKISDLEKMLGEKKQMLISAEDSLQRELLSRSSLETQKLELMSAISELKLQQASLERDNLELRKYQQQQQHQQLTNGDLKKIAYLSRMSPQPNSSTPIGSLNARKSPSPSPVLPSSLTSSPRRCDLDSSPKTPPANYRRQIVELQYASLPRQQFLSNGASLSVVDANANPSSGVGGTKKGVAFGMGLSSLLGVRAKGHSVPNLAETEKVVIGEPVGNNAIPLSPSLQLNKKKGLNKIFGKIRRSNSGTLDDFSSSVGEFQRGGIRATASARLGWTEPETTLIKPNKPFSEWDTENVCDWLQDLGLDQYIPEAKRWVKSGQQLLECSINNIEKELAIKNSLHRKKLQLALIDTEVNGSSDVHLSQAGKLDTAWVLRWLDDTGLPQHKENFLINRVDGRVLHRLTMDDLSILHVTSLLHVASLKRGIQVLRENNFEPACLQRRSLPDDSEHPTFKQISLWTTHRVMEWLRAVDLAEYAPNLRGAGVHGGLMVLENKFNAELLASLLNIPPGKTLLRRHLNTHFKELLGKDIIQNKREAESILGYIPLTPTSKLKVSKKSHFSLKRNKSKSEADYGDLVCPLDENSGQDTNQQQNGVCVTSNSAGTTRIKRADEVAAYHHHVDDESSSSNSPVFEHRAK